jgi:ribokinase
MTPRSDAQPPVIVVGSVNVDLVIQTSELPGRGETVTGGTFTSALGGKGANQAAAAAKLGARVWLVGLTGDDAFGRRAREDLEAHGVDISALGSSWSPTGVAGIFVDRGGENMIAVASGANHDLSAKEVFDRLAEIPAEDAVLLASLEVPDEAILAAAETADRRGWRFILDPAPARPLSSRLLALCDVVTPNRSEADALGSVKVMLEQGVGAVVLTLGADGAQVHRADGSTRDQTSMPVQVVDTTGAGDAFNGALAWRLAGGDDLDEAIPWATAAGALACRGVGARTSLPDRKELEEAVAAWRADR